MTDIIASPAVKEAVKVVMEQQERLGDEAAAEARESQPIRTSVLRAAQLAAKPKTTPAVASTSRQADRARTSRPAA